MIASYKEIEEFLKGGWYKKDFVCKVKGGEELQVIVKCTKGFE